MNGITIKSLAHYIPEGRLTNEEVLENLRRSNEGTMGREDLELLLYGCGRKFDFLGIKTRSFCGHDDNAVTMAVKAARSAMEKAGLQANAIDCLIAAGVSNPFREPSFALIIANSLNIRSGDFFDINDTCNGFLKSMDVACQYIKTGRHKNILLVASENPYELAEGFGIDYSLDGTKNADTRFSAFTVGCGAAAMVISADGPGMKIIDYLEKRETVHWNASLFTVPGVYLPDDEKKNKSPGVWTDARLVAAQIIKEIPGFIGEALDQWNMDIDGVDAIVMHQLGNNVTYATLELLHAPRGKVPVNTFGEFGNMASVNIPSNLSIAMDSGHVKKGDTVLLVGSACGLSYSIVRVQV
ncbi:MAG: hypothetical protein JW969_19690 [Spirochaetales bacterium]|nr:hypothetical protein [Spirochaetales bacterium]